MHQAKIGIIRFFILFDPIFVAKLALQIGKNRVIIFTMKTVYILREDIMSEEELGTYRSFGITCRYDCGEEHIRDISTDREKVADMAERFNRYALSPIHFHDAVEEEIE